MRLAALTFLIFACFSMISFSEICCMFSATRYYGWPFPYLSVHKEVDSYEEASLVTTEPVSTLVSSGWKANFSGHTEKSLLGSPSLSFLADLIFSFAIALSVLLVLIIIKRRFR